MMIKLVYIYHIQRFLGLNPYSNGMMIKRVQKASLTKLWRLNPYSNGMMIKLSEGCMPRCIH